MVKLHPDKMRVRVRQEQFVLAEIQNRCADVLGPPEGWDCAVGCSLLRPDMYWLFNDSNWMLHIEVDETSEHENDDERVANIQSSVNSGAGCMFHTLIRVGTYAYDNWSAAMKRTRLRGGDPAWSARQGEFDRRMDIFEATVREVVKKISNKDESVAGKIQLFIKSQ
jgi:hypothetical protein